MADQSFQYHTSDQLEQLAGAAQQVSTPSPALAGVPLGPPSGTSSTPNATNAASGPDRLANQRPPNPRKRRAADGSPAGAGSSSSSRGVANLTPEQLAKKRANDREAQRAIRERTKNNIEALEARVKELESQKPYQELAAIIRARDAALAENEELKRRLASITTLAHVHQAAAAAQGHGLDGEFFLFCSLWMWEAERRLVDADWVGQIWRLRLASRIHCHCRPKASIWRMTTTMRMPTLTRTMTPGRGCSLQTMRSICIPI